MPGGAWRNGRHDVSDAVGSQHPNTKGPGQKAGPFFVISAAASRNEPPPAALKRRPRRPQNRSSTLRWPAIFPDRHHVIRAALWTGQLGDAERGRAIRLVDTGNQALLLYGYRRASRLRMNCIRWGLRPRALLWSFIVALLVFALGAGVSLYAASKQIERGTRHRPVVN